MFWGLGSSTDIGLAFNVSSVLCLVGTDCTSAGALLLGEAGLSFCRKLGIAACARGDLREGRVLLRLTPVVLGATGLPADFFELTETFLLIPPNFLTSSPGPLAFEDDRAIDFEGLRDEGVVGVNGNGSAASDPSLLPCMPSKK